MYRRSAGRRAWARERTAASHRPGEGNMSVLTSPVTHRGVRRMWDVASDLLIATALIWTLPLLLGAMNSVVRILRNLW